MDESFWSNLNWVILEIFCSKTNPQNESFKHYRSNWIHETNLLNTVGQNQSMKRTFWTGWGFANPKHKICMDSNLFMVRVCTKDSWGYLRIRWIHENSSNLFKISLRFESLNRIFWKHEGFWFANAYKSGFIL